jgi:hypothetical protein
MLSSGVSVSCSGCSSTVSHTNNSFDKNNNNNNNSTEKVNLVIYNISPRFTTELDLSRFLNRFAEITRLQMIGTSCAVVSFQNNSHKTISHIKTMLEQTPEFKNKRMEILPIPTR